ncbi:fatty acid synthase-like [Chironomus tepperi]|uniref:fatty acid synthase-like n=1 Tax=Chironomus tepperi TaxID=113505 RepID=UPI00391FBA41
MDLNDNDIVVSGISGRFPNSNNVREFANNLYNKVDMTDEDESRWKHFHEDVPKRFGKIRNIEKFDASFFSTLNKHANWTDPQMRMLLEHAYESILDAGISPQSLVGSKTGVFIGCSISDSKDAFTHRMPPKDGYVVLGNANFYLSNRISYALGLCGPSFTVDTACSSSAYALDCAFRYIESGLCDAALVGGSQLILNCGLAAEYTKLGILASDGVCRPFDENATGFSRAETICVIFLQKRKDSKRIYANVVYSSSNNDGFKKEGASFPSKIMQQKLIEDFYSKLKFDPENVNFVEAHSTGTKLGDPEEVQAIDAVFCKNNNRPKELVIGSVKSNMGHAEAASGMASITKILLSLESRKFPPNINLKSPRSDVPAFSENRIKVATDVEDLVGDFIAMNSFGLGGGNAHSLFRGNPKVKLNSGVPDDDLGRMLLWSGRTEAAINAIFDDITQRPLDAEHIALLQNSQIQTTSANTYRGYGMFINDKTEGKAVCVKQNIQYFNGSRRPVVFVYSGIGSQWLEMGRDLMKIPLFAQSIEKCHDILMNKGIDLKNIITSSDEDTFSNVLHSYVGIVAIEIALTDILKALNIVPDYIIGHSVGELGCAYADNCFTAEETILAAYARGEASRESHTIKGAMAAVGLNHIKLEEMVPEDIDIACHNGDDSSTISGPADSIHEFVQKLKDDKIFAKEVACSGVPLHSRYITEMGYKLHEKLQEIIKEPKTRSRKWLSSTYPEDMWDEEEACLSSAEYHTRNLLNPVFFKEVTEMLPKNSLMIEVAPHGLLKAILKRNIKEGVHVSLTQRESKDGVEFFMDSLGGLFQHGVDMDISKLYPPVSFPVSRGTPMISPVIKWNHDEDHFVPHFDTYNAFERRNIVINISDKKFEFIQGHMVDGRTLFPATGWIFLVWETFSMMIGAHYEKVKVVFDDIHFLRATSLTKNQDVLITISIHRGTGRFEIIEGNSPVVYGYIKQVDNIEMSEITVLSDDKTLTLNGDDFYQEMRLNGFCHLGPFKGVKEIRHDGLKGKVKWIHNWITFLDSMTHFEERQAKTKKLALPTNIRKVIIDPILHYEMLKEKQKEVNEKLEEVDGKSEEIDILYDVAISPHLKIIKSGGVEFHDKINRVVNRRRPKEPFIETHNFVPFFSTKRYSINDAAKIITQTALENIFQSKCTSVEIDATSVDDIQPLSDHISKALRGIPSVMSDVTFITSRDNLKLENVKISSEELSSFNGVDLVIRNNCIGDEEFFDAVKSSISGHGYIISRENQEFSDMPHENVQVVAKIHTINNEVIHMLQFRSDVMSIDSNNIIEITSNTKEWIDKLKVSLSEAPTLVYAYNRDYSGILGFINCIRREYPVDRLKCFFIMDIQNAPHVFDLNDNFFKSQLELNHAVNVFKDGKWGSYRHLDMPIMSDLHPQTQHCYVNCLVKGDLSTLSWLNGSLDVHNDNLDIIKIHYASLNFKDIMLALGRIPDDCDNPMSQQSILGFEFSGSKRNGDKVMGIGTKAGALATYYDVENTILWKVPDSWTMEEAATVPLVYFTVYFAFFNTTTIKAGKKILIHSGSGGVGQAAIEVAFAYGLEVFTTVSTEEKKNFLLKRFPKLKPENIGNSRNTTFEKMVLENTAGKGVDYVLNSLSDDKLQASIRCLGKDGVFLEIGKYDIVMGTNIDMRYLAKRITMKAVIFDDLADDSEEMKFIYNRVEEDLKAGIIKPLSTTIFEAHQIEEAFRFMANGKHIGKVLLKVRQHEDDERSLPLITMNRVYCGANESIVISGGLGGFGMELSEWLISRGCRKLVLNSRRGVVNMNQYLKVEVWKYYGVDVVINTSDIATEQGCENLIEQAMELGPVGAIFNLAAVLRDAIFENLDQQMFDESLAPKALGTKYLDKVSRVLCPNLKHFVVFSSVSCGRGNAGQSNYGMANSIMERIIEDRHRDGLPGKAIQWGAIGDVGMLADFQLANMEKDIGGTLPQPISSCLEVLDVLLTSLDLIVSSTVVADKHMEDFRKGNVIDIILNIMGIRDKKSISMDSTLTQLGIDSLMGVEIQQILEREFDVSFTSQELRSLTLSQLEKRISSKSSEGSNGNAGNDDAEKVEWMKLLMEGVIDSETLNIISPETLVKVNDVEDFEGTKVLVIPGFYGFAANIYRAFTKEFKYPAYILQLLNTSECEQIDEIVESLRPTILDLYENTEKFIILGHSFGSILALKIAEILENEGKSGQIIQLDGSPQFIHRFSHKMMTEKTLEDMSSSISMVLFNALMPYVDQNDVKTAFTKHDNWESRTEKLINLSSDKLPFTYEFISQNVIAAYINRFKMSLNIKDDAFPILKSTKISLIKATKSSVNGIHKDYALSQYSTHPVKISIIDGDHVTLLTNPVLNSNIEDILSSSMVV